MALACKDSKLEPGCRHHHCRSTCLEWRATTPRPPSGSGFLCLGRQPQCRRAPRLDQRLYGALYLSRQSQHRRCPAALTGAPTVP